MNRMLGIVVICLATVYAPAISQVANPGGQSRNPAAVQQPGGQLPIARQSPFRNIPIAGMIAFQSGGNGQFRGALTIQNFTSQLMTPIVPQNAPLSASRPLPGM